MLHNFLFFNILLVHLARVIVYFYFKLQLFMLMKFIINKKIITNDKFTLFGIKNLNQT